MMKCPTQTQATDVLIGNGDKSGKCKKHREWDPNLTILDHLDTSYDPHGSMVPYSESSLPTGRIIYIFI